MFEWLITHCGKCFDDYGENYLDLVWDNGCCTKRAQPLRDFVVSCQSTSDCSNGRGMHQGACANERTVVCLFLAPSLAMGVRGVSNGLLRRVPAMYQSGLFFARFLPSRVSRCYVSVKTRLTVCFCFCGGQINACIEGKLSLTFSRQSTLVCTPASVCCHNCD